MLLCRYVASVNQAIYTYLVIFDHFRSLSIRKSVFVNIFWFGLDNQSTREPIESKFQMFTGHHVGGLKRSSNMAATLCNFVRNISTNISALEQRTQLKLGELSS